MEAWLEAGRSATSFFNRWRLLVQLDTLKAELPEGTRLCRVMPNTPCLVGEAASTFAMGCSTTEDDRDTVMALMSSVGELRRIPQL